MAFVDELTISAKAGKGGDGVVRWLHLKGKEFGGPSGGDGGRGGDVIIRATRDLNVLGRYKGRGAFKAEPGEDGFRNQMTGKDGDPVIITVPVGSKITALDLKRHAELLEEGDEIAILKGGAGGLGNVNFKSSTNQYPDRATLGKPGEESRVKIEVQLIADVGIIGLPNAGKSSLLNSLTSAKSKVGAYSFTTLEPHLGVFHTYVLADIPGLIEGASVGKGLGHRFLKHVQRTKVMVHCISVEEENPSRIYEKVRKELALYDEALTQKPEIIFLTKTDMATEEELKEKVSELSAYATVVPFSVIDDQLIKKGGERLSAFLSKEN